MHLFLQSGAQHVSIARHKMSHCYYERWSSHMGPNVQQGGRTQDDHPEQQVAAVHLVAQVADEERCGRPHRKERRCNVPSQVPALSHDLSDLSSWASRSPNGLNQAFMARLEELHRGIIETAPGTHLTFSSSEKPNSAAMALRLGAMRFWSAYSRDAVSVKMATM